MLKTAHYNLTMFTEGDSYISSEDRRRFSIIDNELHFLASQIGDGVISGWEIEAVNNATNTVKIKEGLGIIDDFVTNTYGRYTYELLNNKRYYFYIKRKTDILSDRSSFSPMASVSYTDTTPPATPASPTVVETSYNYIKLSWTANTEVDLDRYELWRSDNNVTFVKIADLTTNSYTDEDVDQNTIYYYKLLSYDQNELTNGTFSATLQASTDLDSRVPSDPESVDIVNGDQTLQVIWDAGAFLVNSYHITLQAIDTEGAPEGLPSEYDVSNTTFYLFIDGLTNGQNYTVTIKSVSSTGTESNGITVNGQPVSTSGSQQISDFVWTDFAIDSSWNVAINLSWSTQSDSYLPEPAYYVVTVIRDNEVGDSTIYLENSIVLNRYTVNGDERTIYENTKYIIKVQTATSDGILSESYILRLKTHKFSSPGPVTNVNASYVFTPIKKTLTLTWKNTSTEFSYNTLTVKRTFISNSSSSSSVSYILQDYNYGQAEKYNVPKIEILNNCIYTFIIKTYDFAGNVSEDAGTSIIINVTFPGTFIPGVGNVSSDRPPAADNATSISGNGQVTLYWAEVESDNLDKYCVWRAPYSLGSFLAESFEKLIELDKSVRKYTDYNVTNGSQYVYFITTKDIYGIESLNPADDEYVSYSFLAGEPREFGTSLSVPPAISASVDGNNVVLSWEPDPASFDGYEIYRSIGSKAAFEKIDVIDSFQIGYIDEGGLNKSGSYYYMIRKFREEAEIFYTTNTNSAPLGSLIIGMVSIFNNQITIDNDIKYNIALLEDPIIEETKKQFSVPTHLYYSTRDDRRIRLSDDLIVLDWTTEDYKQYNTVTDIRGTSDYVAYVGESQSLLNTYIDRENGILYFEDFIVDPSTITDENPAPTITVIFLNTGEVENTLPAENIGEIIANKISKGKVSSGTLKQIDHFGRYRENCIPVRYDATRNNGNTYEATTPSGVTFYDLLIASTDQIVAATNEGVRVSKVSDNTRWELPLSAPLLSTKVFYSNQYNWYFALCVDKVYYTKNLTEWFVIDGVTGANFIQDIVEDDSGNIFISSDSGVYRLNPSEFLKLQWQQVEPIDLLNNNTYALLWLDGKLYASVENGIYTTEDLGNSWVQFSGTEIQVPMFSLIYSNGTFFGTSKDKIWRKTDSQNVFTAIETFSFEIRKLVEFNNDLYVTTDKGLFRSSPLSDIYEDSNIKFDIAFQSLVRNGFMPCTYALRKIGSRLYIGLDERIYSITTKRKVYIHADVPGINPIIFVDEVERNVGMYFSLKNKIVSDSRLLPQSKVQIVRDYTIFNVENGGWAESKYDAPVALVINGVEQSPTVKPKTDANSIDAAVKTIVTPFFNARTANFNDALKYLKLIVQSVDAIDTIQLLTPTQDIDSATIAQLFAYVNLFKMNLNPSIRDTVVLPPITAGTTTTSGYTFEVDVVNGKLTISTGVTKYTKVQLSIKGVGVLNTGEYSHKEIEDKFELVNSGLTASLASVQQSNIIKMGIHDETIYQNGLVNSNLSYQSRFFSGCDSWYDTFESTLNYELQEEQKPHQIRDQEGSFSLNYPSDILYESGSNIVWVCGQGGIIGINASTYDSIQIFEHDAYFFNMHQSGDYVWSLADDGLYKININTYTVTKQVDTEILEGASSVLRFGDTTFLSTNTGLYFKKDTDLNWKLLFEIKDAFVRASQKVTFCAGQNPTATDIVGEVYYSTGGVSWNRSTQFEDILISGVTQRYDSVYYATNKGVIVEDLSGLFSGSGTTIAAVDLDGDDIADEVQINAIDSDNTKVIAATPDGKYYQLGGTSVLASGQSKLSTIHKVKVVNGKYWLFADNLIDIEGVDRFIQLSTGKALV